jgi:protein-disulfide isomerase
VNRKYLFVGTCLLLVVSFFLGARLYRSQRAKRLDFMAREDSKLFVPARAPVLGEDDAKVFLVKFTDPACETCAAFAPYVDSLLKKHEGKLKLVVRYAPFHEGADNVVRVLEASRKQGRFWTTLHLLYRSQRAWTHHHKVSNDALWKVLPHAGLDLVKLKKDMAAKEIQAVIDQDLADAKTLGVNKTPGFFVNGKPLEPFGLQSLVDMLEAEVKAQYPGE